MFFAHVFFLFVCAETPVIGLIYGDFQCMRARSGRERVHEATEFLVATVVGGDNIPHNSVVVGWWWVLLNFELFILVSGVVLCDPFAINIKP